jgi:hypothetical protein
MKAKGWEVTLTNWDSERGVYAWRHEVGGRPSTGLLIVSDVTPVVAPAWADERYA